MSTTTPRGLLGVAGGYALPHPEACHWLLSGLCRSTQGPTGASQQGVMK